MYISYTDNENKICFWWSPKSGCTFVKKLYCFLTSAFQYTNKQSDLTDVIDNIDQYVHILFVRNPYKRFVSGFLDCYVNNNKFLPFKENMTFVDVINDMVVNGIDNVDPIHFDYQSHTRNVENITSSEVSFYKIYDIEQMTFDDFTFINNLFPDSLDLTENTIKSLRLSWHNGKHEIRNKNVSDVSDVSKLTINELKNLPVNPSYNKFFLDDSLKENIRKIYFKDYEFFQIHNINFPEIFSGNII